MPVPAEKNSLSLSVTGIVNGRFPHIIISDINTADFPFLPCPAIPWIQAFLFSVPNILTFDQQFRHFPAIFINQFTVIKCHRIWSGRIGPLICFFRIDPFKPPDPRSENVSVQYDSKCHRSWRYKKQDRGIRPRKHPSANAPAHKRQDTPRSSARIRLLRPDP